jgi:hypothetical protein
MTATIPPPNLNNEPEARFVQWLRLGQIFYAQGDQRRAHRYWRRAAMLNPYSEAVWVALLSVLKDEADRQVCLQNILTINPLNEEAQRQWWTLRADAAPRQLPTQPIPLPRRIFWEYVLLRVLEIVTFAVMLVTISTALPYVRWG